MSFYKFNNPDDFGVGIFFISNNGKMPDDCKESALLSFWKFENPDELQDA